jgi:hypothetical protein
MKHAMLEQLKRDCGYRLDFERRKNKLLWGSTVRSVQRGQREVQSLPSRIISSVFLRCSRHQRSSCHHLQRSNPLRK